MSVIYLIRHGQASFLQEDYDKLSNLGITQAEVLGVALKARKVNTDIVVRGTMKRHEETADHCFKLLGVSPTVDHSHAWNEYDHLEVIRLHKPEFESFDALADFIQNQDNPMFALQQILNNAIRDWMSDKHDYKVNWLIFKENILNELASLAERLNKGETAIVFTSGGPISVILLHLFGLKDEQFIDLQGKLVNSSITKIVSGKSGLFLSTYNDYGHLEHKPEWITYR